MITAEHVETETAVLNGSFVQSTVNLTDIACFITSKSCIFYSVTLLGPAALHLSRLPSFSLNCAFMKDWSFQWNT